MLPALAGFVARPTAVGYLLVRARSGFIRYERRVRPISAVSALVEARLDQMTVTARSPITATYTAEGEHAARVTLDGTRDGSWIRREIGVVFGDDFASVVDATCIDRTEIELFEAAVDTLVRGLVLGAPARRRRYRYSAPPGRRPRVRYLETDWIADDTLTVFPAERAGPELTFAIAKRDHHDVVTVDRHDDTTTIVVAASAHRWRAVAATSRSGWLYAMELVACRERTLEPLLACIASIVPLPEPQQRSAPVLGVFEVE